MNKHSDSLFRQLAKLDTPTICNAMEIVAPETRRSGYTTSPLICPFPDMPAVVGYARTATIRAAAPSARTGKEQQNAWLAYFEYLSRGEGPGISVIQDLDGASAGTGSFWGEVNSALHKAFGCNGVITNGSIRDLDQWAPELMVLAGSVGPSHAFVHVERFGDPVRVAGMTVNPNDIIHMDKHGAVIIPHEVAERIPEAAERCVENEAVLLKLARGGDFSFGALKEIILKADSFH